jgi:hypothetical protein
MKLNIQLLRFCDIICPMNIQLVSQYILKGVPVYDIRANLELYKML